MSMVVGKSKMCDVFWQNDVGKTAEAGKPCYVFRREKVCKNAWVFGQEYIRKGVTGRGKGNGYSFDEME